MLRARPSEPLAFLEDRDLFDDLADQPRFTEAYLAALDSLHSLGARATLEEWRHGDPTRRRRAGSSSEYSFVVVWCR